MRLTWSGCEAGLECPWLSRDGRTRALHRDCFHGAGTRHAGCSPLLSLHGLLDGGVVRGQVGQLVEDVALADYGVHQVTVTYVRCKKGGRNKQTNTTVQNVKEKQNFQMKFSGFFNLIQTGQRSQVMSGKELWGRISKRPPVRPRPMPLCLQFYIIPTVKWHG